MLKVAKQERERKIFEVLAPLIGFEVVPDSITQPDPPDIVCEVVGLGQVGIELVALDAPRTRSRLDNMPTTDEAWDRALTTWPTDKREALGADFRDAYFSIAFRNEAGLRDRTAALKALQTFLLDNPGFKGVVAPSSIGCPRNFESLTIHRGSVKNGPKFSHFSAGRWSPPHTVALEAKLRPGRYAHVCVPLELFAYAVHDEPDLALGSLEHLQNVVVGLLPQSAFRRVHVFDLGFLRHLSSHSASTLSQAKAKG
jgi:hypothetical protein